MNVKQILEDLERRNRAKLNTCGLYEVLETIEEVVNENPQFEKQGLLGALLADRTLILKFHGLAMMEKYMLIVDIVFSLTMLLTL